MKPAPAPVAVTRFVFHHKELHPYDVQSFSDNKKLWRVLLTKGFNVNLHKDEIVRIEAVDDIKDYRTWFDSTGKHSTVAKFIDFKDPFVRLHVFDGNLITLSVHKLSEVDKRHLQKIVHPKQL
ncbi:MAG: SHD1 domain-containing protein [Planctomycetaceae bacterium]